MFNIIVSFLSELIYRIWESLSAKLLFVDTARVFIRNEVNIMSMNKMTAAVTAAVTAALEKLGYRRIRELQITCPTQSRTSQAGLCFPPVPR